MQVGSVSGTIEVYGADCSHPFSFPLTHEDLDMPMDKIAKLVGDADARVTTSLDMADKKFGRGFGAHVSVSLSCEQDKKTLDKAAEISLDLAGEYLDDAFQRAADIADEYGLIPEDDED